MMFSTEGFISVFHVAARDHDESFLILLATQPEFLGLLETHSTSSFDFVVENELRKGEVIFSRAELTYLQLSESNLPAVLFINLINFTKTGDKYI